MIRDTIPNFIKRISDYVLHGRNRTRIVLGTDRKDSLASGYGEGGKNDVESGAIDIVAGFQQNNPSYTTDGARLYLSGKTDPDDYLGVNAGTKIVGQPAALLASENVYINGRENIKIICGNVQILIDQNNILIKAEQNLSIKCGSSFVKINQDGQISIGSESGPSKRIITEDDISVGTDPVTGGPIISSFTRPDGGVINNQKIVVKL